MNDSIVQLIVIALGSSLVSNVVLSQFLGLHTSLNARFSFLSQSRII